MTAIAENGGDLAKRARGLLRNAGILLVIAAAAWLLELFDQILLDGALDSYGIEPRTARGLRGVFLAPLLHSGFAHLASNTIPFVVLAWFAMLQGRGRFVALSFGLTLLGGAGTWLVGASGTVHLGASGLIFGYLGLLLGRGVFDRSAKSVVLALAAAVLYGGLIFGVLPGRQGVSWEGHLFGFAAGFLLARLTAGPKEE